MNAPLPQSRKPRFFYGWVIVLVIALAQFTQSAEIFPVLSVFLKPMTEEFGWSRSVFTGATTVGTLIGGVIALFVGKLVDRFGARWTIVIGLGIMGGCLILMGYINTLWHFYALQILGRSIVMGATGLAASIVIPKWFVIKRGRAVAIGGLGGRLGNSITPLYVQYLVSTSGWRIATMVTGAVIWIVSLLPTALFLRRVPEDMGLLPDGVNKEELEIHNKQSNLEQSQPSEVSFTLKEVSKLPSFYLLIAAFCLLFYAGAGQNLHMIPFFTDRGLDAGTSVSIVAIWSASGAIGSLISGFLAEKFGIRIVTAIIFLLVAVGYIFMLFIETPAMGFLWGFTMGIIQGGMFILYQIIFADYYGRDSLGAIRGVVWPIQMITNSVGPLSAAAVYDITGSYFLIFAVFSALSVVSGILIFFAYPPITKSQ